MDFLKTLFSISILFLLSACIPFGSNTPPPQPEHLSELGPLPTTSGFVRQTCSDDVCAGPIPNSYWIKNPTSGALLYTDLVLPSNPSASLSEMLVLVPGDLGTIDLRTARQLADYGYAVLLFDPDGRGRSQGDEDFNGLIQQDGLEAVIRATSTFTDLKIQKIGLVSFSSGIAMASGALARYPELPVSFLIDWEGPADREDTTSGCSQSQSDVWPSCADDAAWLHREALNSIGKIKVQYQRLQSEQDHLQTNHLHAVKMVNAAVSGGVPWVRLNNLPEGQSYDPASPPTMLPEKADSGLILLIARYARELFDLQDQ